MPTAANTRAPAHVFRCSFCTKSSDEVAKLVAGPGVYICDECVGLCHEILASHTTTGDAPAEWTPPWASLRDDELLAALAGIAASVDRVELTLAAWVEQLRERRVSWARIGEALGMTRQSAWERFASMV